MANITNQITPDELATIHRLIDAHRHLADAETEVIVARRAIDKARMEMTAKYFEENTAKYRLPEMLVVEYSGGTYLVHFDVDGESHHEVKRLGGFVQEVRNGQ